MRKSFYANLMGQLYSIHTIHVLYCISLGPQPVGVQCPSFPHEVSCQVIGNGSGFLGYRPCWCPSPFPPVAFHISVFIHWLFTCHWISFVFLLYDWCISAAIVRSFTYSLLRWVSRFWSGSGTRCCGPTLYLLMVSFQASDWLWYSMMWSQRPCLMRTRPEANAQEAEISFRISALAGVWSSDLAV